MDLVDKIIELTDLFDDNVVTTADKIPQPEPKQEVLDREAINRFMKDNPPGMAGGGRIGFDKGGEVEKRTKIITKAVDRYNKLLNDGLAKKNISKIPAFQGWFKKNYSKIPISTANKYISQGRVKVKPLIKDKVKFDFVQQLVDEANAKTKHTKWIDIESKVTNFEGRKSYKRADTKIYREYIDQLDSIEDKYNKAFQNILDNPDEPLNLKFKKYPSGSNVDRTSFLKKYLYEQVQAGTTANIKKALDKNPFYSKNKDLIEKYAFYSGTVGGEGRSFQGKTFNEALQFGKDNMGGRVIFSGSGKTKGPAEDIYNFALRSWDTSNRQQIPLSNQKVIFYDKKTNKPIKWGDVPRGKDNSKKLKINDVYFKYKEDPKNTKWDIETVRGKGKASGLFDEVYDSFKAYQTLVNTEVDNPFGKGKVKLSEVIKNVAEKGYGKTAGVYGLAKDHQLGVSNEPFKKIRIIPQRLNLTLKQIGDIKGSDKFKTNLTNELLQEFKGLKGTKYNQAVQNNILNIAEEINKGFSTTESGYRELGKKIASDPKKLAMYSPAEQIYIKQIAGEINPYKATQMLAAFPKGPKLATKYIPKSDGPTLGMNLGFLKGFGEAIKAVPTPAGAVALNLGLGVDPTSAIDRASIAAEAAFAPGLVKQAAKFGPVAQRFFNLGLSPAMAARAARIASPIGLASLAAEGAYQAGKFTKKRIAELKAMSPEERDELRRQGEAFAFDPFQAAGGGIAKLAGDPSGAMLESMNPDSQGLRSLKKRVKTI